MSEDARDEAAEASVDAPEAPETDITDEFEDIEDLKQQLSDAQSKVAEYWDQLVRANAEMENIKRRATRDVEHAHKFAVEKLANNLLPVVDSLEQGIGLVKADTDIDAIKQGMELTNSMLLKVLEGQGMTQLDPAGEKFNPELHEAMTMVPSDSIPADHVMDVFQKGYQLNGRLIRPARVVVSQGNGQQPGIDTKA